MTALCRRRSSSVLTSEPSLMTSQEPMCLGNSSATEKIKRLDIYSSLRVGAAVIKSYAELYFTVLPNLCFRLRIYCKGSGHISVGTTSHVNFSSIQVCSSILPYLHLYQIVLWALAWTSSSTAASLADWPHMPSTNGYAHWWKWH